MSFQAPFKHTLGAVAAIAALSAAPAHALTISLNDIGGVTGSPAQVGFAMAASYWENVITTPGTVSFDVGFSPLGTGILGSTGTNLATFVPITTYYAALDSHAGTALDAQVQRAPLSSTGSVTVTVPAYYNPATQGGAAVAGTRIAPDGAPISNTIALPTSLAHSLGISGGDPGADAEIQFSSTFGFDFNPTDGISAGQYDFLGVAIHEMGHALGFLSGVQDFDYVAGAEYGNVGFDQYWWGYAADLFKYSANGTLNWTFNTAEYTSIDRGASALLGDSYWSTGEVNGDGWQASHWKAPASGGCNAATLIGVMNPYTCGGFMDSMTANDVALLDTIGWNVNVDVLSNPNYAYTTAQVYAAYVPEPGTYALMALGLVAIGGFARSRRA